LSPVHLPGAALVAGIPLGLAQALGGETVVVIAQPEGWQAWVAILADIATIFIALALIAVALALIFAALQSRKIYGKVHALLGRVREDLSPVIGHATDVAENVNYMSTAIRSDVDQLRASLESARLRITDVAGAAEHRVRRFNALLDVVQDEAEGLFIETASTLRGVQAGARTLREESGTPSEERPVPDPHATTPARRRSRYDP
jgi:methyl-accepting chemotaxis protein